MKNGLKILGIFMLSICALFDITACKDKDDDEEFNGEILTGSSTRNVNGYDYELWNQNNQGIARMKIGSNENGGIFRCEWSGILNVLFRAGKKYNRTQKHSEIGVFSIDYDAVHSFTGDVSYLSVYGWVDDPLIEYYIVEARGSYNPGAGGPNSINYGTVTIDGEDYDLYETTRINQPSINGTRTFKQYWSIRKTNRTGGTISVSEHFNAWANKGMTGIRDGKFYEVALKVEGYQNNGSAEIHKNILKVNGVPVR
jgi:endo-1,4-beta-xylanase